jgi:hypothetical protein
MRRSKRFTLKATTPRCPPPHTTVESLTPPDYPCFTNSTASQRYEAGLAPLRPLHPTRTPPPGWHPRLLDYVYFSFSNGTAFSATDVMPLSHWAKLLMMVVQAGSSLSLVVLVTARAVNVL